MSNTNSLEGAKVKQINEMQVVEDLNQKLLKHNLATPNLITGNITSAYLNELNSIECPKSLCKEVSLHIMSTLERSSQFIGRYQYIEEFKPIEEFLNSAHSSYYKSDYHSSYIVFVFIIESLLFQRKSQINPNNRKYRHQNDWPKKGYLDKLANEEFKKLFEPHEIISSAIPQTPECEGVSLLKKIINNQYTASTQLLELFFQDTRKEGSCKNFNRNIPAHLLHEAKNIFKDDPPIVVIARFVLVIDFIAEILFMEKGFYNTMGICPFGSASYPLKRNLEEKHVKQRKEKIALFESYVRSAIFTTLT